MIHDTIPNKLFAIGRVKNKTGTVDYFMVIYFPWKTMRIYDPSNDVFVTGHPKLIFRLKTAWVI